LESEKGMVFVYNGNPLYYSFYGRLFNNMLFLSMCKNIVLDYVIGSSDNLPIPGGEAGI